MFAQILNRPWKVSAEQAQAICNTEMSRRKVFFGGAMVAVGVVLAGCTGWNGDVATLTKTVVDYVTNTAGALLTSLAGITAIQGLPASWAATLATIKSLVTAIQSIAAGISTTTLVSTASGAITSFVTDFNAIVNAILANPIVSAAVSGTGFGWALSLATFVLPLVEQAVQVVIALVIPPTPTPLPAPVAAHRLMTVRLNAATMDPATANQLLAAIAAGKM